MRYNYNRLVFGFYFWNDDSSYITVRGCMSSGRNIGLGICEGKDKY